ncbi:MAG: 2-amino-4-hydroxy-6-hydroxymethyldihydropteridine diphosphokinase [Bacteroidota bacterium]|nr:2-amino-4-hydroxy-6-hydroxymethyldihydropteridine diphosphokinase [Bacteroidota bacterium]
MNVVFLCLGGNIGNREGNLNLAISKISQMCGRIISSSSIYETDAWGSYSSLKYLNQVVQIHTKMDANELLKTLLNIEIELGRQRTSNQNADRIIDIDILFFNDEIINLPHIQIPHPRLHLRNFVLKPFSEINEAFLHPQLKKNIKELLLECPDSLTLSLFKKKIVFFFNFLFF